MAEDYLDWHTGVEIDRATRRWRGYIAKLDSDERRFTEESYEDKEDAAVAASDLLSAAREGGLPPPPG